MKDEVTRCVTVSSHPLVLLAFLVGTLRVATSDSVFPNSGTGERSWEYWFAGRATQKPGHSSRTRGVEWSVTSSRPLHVSFGSRRVNRWHRPAANELATTIHAIVPYWGSLRTLPNRVRCTVTRTYASTYLTHAPRGSH
jgi:hypothetical protein